MIAPGKSFDVFFTPPRAGTFIYHTHMNDMAQLGSGLYGPIIVLPPGETFQPETDRVFLISRTGMRKVGEMLLNGTTQPQPQSWHSGVPYRLRFININGNNTVIVTLSQNGVPVAWKSIAKDGADLPPEQALTAPASFLIAPGETYDFQVRPEAKGDMELKLFLSLFKETVTQVIRVDHDSSP
jgi:FtsP/CotA-like multicopper oxidase with cupredoxin domain